MTTIRTSTALTKNDARRLMRGKNGFQIAYIETRRTEAGDQSEIVWSRPSLPGEIPLSECPY